MFTPFFLLWRVWFDPKSIWEQNNWWNSDQTPHFYTHTTFLAGKRYISSPPATLTLDPKLINFLCRRAGGHYWGWIESAINWYIINESILRGSGGGGVQGGPGNFGGVSRLLLGQFHEIFYSWAQAQSIGKLLHCTSPQRETAEYSAACRSTLVLGGECNRTSVSTLLAQLALC